MQQNSAGVLHASKKKLFSTFSELSPATARVFANGFYLGLL